MSYYLETYGCSLNKADSDIIVGRLAQIGAKRVPSVDEAEVIILNSCGVKEPTEDRIIHRLSKLSEEEKPIVVAGCLPKISLHRIQTTVPKYAALLGPQSIDTLGEVFQRVVRGERGIIHLDIDPGSKLRFLEGPPRSVICTVPICEGCLGNCTYCAVRFARGSVRSYSIQDILRTVERCVHLGFLEIRLTSQDAGVFGSDTGESLVDLLWTLAYVSGNHRFRLGMFNPDLVQDYLSDMVEVMKTKHFFRFFHAPLQSGSDSVLASMGRRYTVSDWKEIVSTIRGTLPQATIATDIIVGFPGETDEDFDLTMEVIKQVHPQVVNISKYGDRPGTQASKSTEKVSTSIKKARSRRLSALVSELSLKHNKSWIGWRGEVIVTKLGPKGGTVSRNHSYKPIIVHDEVSIGDTIDLTVYDADRTYLLGRISDSF